VSVVNLPYLPSLFSSFILLSAQIHHPPTKTLSNLLIFPTDTSFKLIVLSPDDPPVGANTYSGPCNRFTLNFGIVLRYDYPHSQSWIEAIHIGSTTLLLDATTALHNALRSLSAFASLAAVSTAHHKPVESSICRPSNCDTCRLPSLWAIHHSASNLG
jgi:hypothetical protein